ncbi:putative rnp domain-containing protein [Diaporthe ampelina]|uniref:Putative rnp domain-containing protein n=1 Tax=Diaporthe ampelina TaxID=1214573 RepID=A0A0G2HCJ3_9PEZI|nr:putative rnp domain-containing protein [Diaporthe ampelina]
MPMSPSSYMTSPGASFSHGAMIPSCDVLTATYPQPSLPTTTYGYYGSGVEAQQPFYGYQAAPDRQPALYNHSASYAVQPIQPYSDYYPHPPPPNMNMAALTNQMADLTMGGGPVPSGGVVYTEQRGIHIRELSRRASEEQVRRMICEAAGREASLINVVDVPLDKEGSPRGYAIVHFRSADLARRMVSRLHGVDFKGRKLQVRLLKEGEAVGVGAGSGAMASPPARGHGHGHRSGRHHSSSARRDEGRRPERRDRDKERGPDRGEKKVSSTSSSASKGMPLVVGGDLSAAESSVCPSPSSSSKCKDKGRERHGGKKSAVVIADGSSRRADKS